MIRIIDYGVGNLRSVQKAFEALGFEAEVTGDIEKIRASKALVLPGVGAFPDAMKELNNKGMTEEIINFAKSGRPLLGICLGMQLLFEVGYEFEECKGLGLIGGSINMIKADVKIPHMGWNDLKFINDCALLKGVKEGSYMYFVHSFLAEVKDRVNLNATAFYGLEIPAIVSNNNIYGTQFHPEKSGKAGMQILKNFGEVANAY